MTGHRCRSVADRCNLRIIVSSQGRAVTIGKFLVGLALHFTVLNPYEYLYDHPLGDKEVGGGEENISHRFTMYRTAAGEIVIWRHPR